MSCAQCSRYLWLEIREGPVGHSWSFIKGDGFCSARGSSSFQPSQLQRKCSALWFCRCAQMTKCQTQNFFLRFLNDVCLFLRDWIDGTKYEKVAFAILTCQYFTQWCYGLETEQGLKWFFYLFARQQKDWGLGERSGCLLICELYFITKEEEELEVPLEGLGFQQQESRLCQQMKMATVAPSPEPVCWQVEPVPSTNSGHVCTPGRTCVLQRILTWGGELCSRL